MMSVECSSWDSLRLVKIISVFFSVVSSSAVYANDLNLTESNSAFIQQSEWKVLPYPEWALELLPAQTLAQTSIVAVNKINKRNDVSNKLNFSTESNEANEPDEWDLEELDYSEFSDDLAQHLKSAIQGVDGDQDFATQNSDSDSSPSSDIDDRDITDILSWEEVSEGMKSRLPKIDLQAHIYASVANQRSIWVNGVEIMEGQMISPKVKLETIEPRHIVMIFEKQRIAMPALSEW